ncbi:hypothetical protein CD58_22215 [Pseudomonas brassicacearum]|uniref:hypothetical protein n=1 Tax=Pseudomonas TaxID=286 RepID=UPI00042ED747|nr:MULTISPECIES: hypothetical protein [Pseudomonas]AHL35422.1 hypothetical protein CD58_22215 [Pseudomonas brassicacearum]UZE16589.1 hypothetical protein LOY70_22245 [Pseudomonas sp. B21-054]
MKVKCIVNNLSSDKLSAQTLIRLKPYISRSDGELNLEIGKEYVVYGIEFWDNCPWFYLCPDDYDEYPIPVAADFFEITDKRLSAHWELNFKETSNGENQTQLVFFEWATDEVFYENLISGDDQAEAIFEKYRKIMEVE